MGLVQAYPAQLIAIVQHYDPVRLLYHLHQKLLVDEWHSKGPTLVRRIRIRNAGKGYFAEFLYHRGRPGLQDRTFVVPDQLVVVADTDLAGRQSGRTALSLGPLLRPARQVRYRARTRYGRLEPRKRRMIPYPGKVRDRCGAVRFAASRPDRRRRLRHGGPPRPPPPLYQ